MEKVSKKEDDVFVMGCYIHVGDTLLSLSLSA